MQINIKANGEDRKDREPAPAFSGPAVGGGRGDDASCGFFDDDCATRGGVGGRGADGASGADGEHGAHAGTIQIEAQTFDVLLAISAKGGRGGRGGRGGDGQKGGPGGIGGAGEDCEDGGRGGDGGAGGNAGHGGSGGNGGDGGVIVLIARDLTNTGIEPFMDVSGGAPGGEGDAGLAGQGGDPGPDAPGTGVFSPSSDCDRRPPNPGAPGNSVPPDPNRSGLPGNRGVATRRVVA